MITIVTCWETLQMDPELEWRMWRQLKGAFDIDRFVFAPCQESMMTVNIDQYDDMQEALDSCQGSRVFLEVSGEKNLSEIPSGDIVLVLGNTQGSNIAYAQPGETYKIATPSPTDMYGLNAAAIALAYHYGQ